MILRSNCRPTDSFSGNSVKRSFVEFYCYRNGKKVDGQRERVNVR